MDLGLVSVGTYVAMWTRVACVCLFVSSVVTGEPVTKKLCDDVGASQCTVHSAAVDPCPKNANFCPLKRDKSYLLTIDFTPRFSAQNLRMAMFGDDANDGSFSKPVKIPEDPCGTLLTCPVDRAVPRMFDFHFRLDKTLAAAKFPVKFKLWNADDESQACCFTFNVKVKK